MPYVILVENDNSLYGSCKSKIMQREKLFNKLCFLVAPYYNGFDMSQCTVTMRYLKPISKEFVTETLVLSDETYKDYLKYVLPIDTDLTREFGDTELNLTFTMLDADINGKVVQRVRKTDNYILHITQVPDWDSVIPDPALAALDQRIIKTQAQIKELERYAEAFVNEKADNIKYNEDTHELRLLSGDKEIGDKVIIKSGDTSLSDGIPVVDFNSVSNTPSADDDNESNVIEF